MFHCLLMNLSIGSLHPSGETSTRCRSYDSGRNVPTYSRRETHPEHEEEGEKEEKKDETESKTTTRHKYWIKYVSIHGDLSFISSQKSLAYLEG